MMFLQALTAHYFNKLILFQLDVFIFKPRDKSVIGFVINSGKQKP